MSVNIVQINLNKSKKALDNFYSFLVRNPRTVGILNEPYSYRGIIPKHKDFSIFGVGRAVIVAPKHFSVLACAELSSHDYTVVILKTEQSEQFLASMYLDITKSIISSELVKICNFFKDNKVNAVIGMDSNSHSPFWGSDNSNARGLELEAFIVQNQLVVLNKGNVPTFQTSRAKSVIDVTLAYGKYNHIHNWHVMENQYFFSDHKGINFQMTIGHVPQPTVDVINFVKFKEELVVSEHSHSIWTAEAVESEALYLQQTINDALAKSIHKKAVTAKQAKFWTNELFALRGKVVRLNSIMMHNPNNPQSREEFLAAQKHFYREVRKSKRLKWRAFCEGITCSKNMSKFNKILKRNNVEHIGLLKKADGTLVGSPQQSIDLLLSTHHPGCVPLTRADNSTRANIFPGSKAPPANNSHTSKLMSKRQMSNRQPPNDDCQLYQNFVFCSNEDLDNSFINERTVYLAVHSFGPDKAAGPDNIKPKILQCFIENKAALSRLTKLYQAMVELSYCPKTWCEAKVIFIQKPGKTDYSQAKSFRPISLTSFLLKTVEKLILWEIQGDSLESNPISKKQHAFRKGYSCQTAISDLVDSLEANILRDKFSLSVFLDIAGAFDNIQYPSIIAAMNKRGISPKIVNWYKFYLEHRIAYTELKGMYSSVKVRRGCPQGGILSPVVWNLVFDSFIELFNSSPAQVGCYADDAVLTVHGIDPNTLVEIMQPELDKAFKWGRKEKLLFVPEKTSAILFHRKRIAINPKKLTLNGVPIQYKSEVKYLGIFLDQRLSWKYHIDQKINKAKKAIMLLRNSMGKLWGVAPKILKWGYEGIIIPSLSYGCAVWHRVCQDGKIAKKLSTLNRLMMLTLMPARRSTPTIGLEVILGFTPLDIKIKELALNELLRIIPHKRTKWDGCGKKGNGHLRAGQNKLQELGINKYEFDSTKTIHLKRDYKVDLESFKSGQPISSSVLSAYTDGSKLNQHTGYGLGIFKGITTVAEENGYLGENNSVFQGEIAGIQRACENLYNCRTESVTIFSDSQAALGALSNWKVQSKTVENCINSLNQLSLQTNVELKWVKSHSNFSGNEFADYQAKLGTTNRTIQMECPTPISWAKQLIKQGSYKEWTHKWYYSKAARQTKIWFPSLNKNYSRSLINLNRADLGLMVEMLTGHNRLNRHQSLVDKDVSPTCRKCREEDETSYHIIAACPRLLFRRWEAFNTPFLDENPIWHPKSFLKFLRLAKIKEMNQRESIGSSQNA